MHAEVSELADELDSGSSGGFRREGSSPFFRIRLKEKSYMTSLFLVLNSYRAKRWFCSVFRYRKMLFLFILQPVPQGSHCIQITFYGRSHDRQQISRDRRIATGSKTPKTCILQVISPRRQTYHLIW